MLLASGQVSKWRCQKADREGGRVGTASDYERIKWALNSS